jgi:hypothetical protein
MEAWACFPILCCSGFFERLSFPEDRNKAGPSVGPNALSGQKESDQRLSFPNQGRVPHISLVFREMWDTTALSL